MQSYDEHEDPQHKSQRGVDCSLLASRGYCSTRLLRTASLILRLEMIGEAERNPTLSSEP